MEVISRAEEYLNYALKNQETYPEPVARMDYYLLSLAQEVRSGNSNVGLNFEDKNVLEDRKISANVDDTIIKQEYLGGYIEVQPDSWDGEVCAVDDSTKTWGFPYSLNPTERQRIKDLVLNGKGTNIMYVRLPLGFAYRGYRNIDTTTGLAKNIGERYLGQNKVLKEWFSDISANGGGIAPEYWCPPPYWVTSQSYNGANQLRAGGTYEATTTLASIKTTDETQYNAQIDAFTDAIVDDLEYLHQNIAPVRMFGLQNEPVYSTQPYGACKYDKQTYNDVLEALIPKINASSILSTYNDEPNEVKIHVASSDESNPFGGIASTFIENHSDLIWGYSHHSMRKASGEAGDGYGADWYKSTSFSNIKGDKNNVIINEYEYFSTTYGTDDFRCSNNMLHLINEAVYGEAKVLHPVIHICKPLGQTLGSTNTKGYCLFEANLSGEYGVEIDNSKNTHKLAKGTVTPNPTMYNSWQLFGENLPIGAYLVGDYSNTIDNLGWCTYKFDNKLYIFIANNGDKDSIITLTFNEEKEFEGKYYNVEHVGSKISSKRGTTVDFVVPAYSGQCWVAQKAKLIHVPCEGIEISSNTLIFTESATQRLSAVVKPNNTTDKITWSSSDLNVCTVNNGIVTPLANGSCTITATCGGHSATCDVTVNIVIETKVLSLTKGSINSSSGLDETNDYKYKTDFIEVDGEYTIFSNALISSKAGFVCRTYDENKKFIENNPSSLSYANSTKTYILNEKAKYIRLVFAHPKNTSSLPSLINGDIIKINNIEYEIEINESEEKKIELTLGGINSSTGVDETNAYKYRSDYIAVDTSLTVASDVIKSGSSGAAYILRTYDINKEFLGTVPSNITISSNKTFTFDEDVKYIRFIFANPTSSTSLPSITNNDIIKLNDVEYKVVITE